MVVDIGHWALDLEKRLSRKLRYPGERVMNQLIVAFEFDVL